MKTSQATIITDVGTFLREVTFYRHTNGALLVLNHDGSIALDADGHPMFHETQARTLLRVPASTGCESVEWAIWRHGPIFAKATITVDGHNEEIIGELSVEGDSFVLSGAAPVAVD
jgi:hypothetical protein